MTGKTKGIVRINCCKHLFLQLRFERRFMPFQAVDTPQLMLYGHYKEYSNISKMNASQVRAGLERGAPMLYFKHSQTGVWIFLGGGGKGGGRGDFE